MNKICNQDIIRFIEQYESGEYYFRVASDVKYYGGDYPLLIYNQTPYIHNIFLDKEDLDYLYNKYLPLYKQAKEKELLEKKLEKQKKIHELEVELKKLKSNI